MKQQNNRITVFEHEIVRFDRGENRISKAQFEALETYYGNGVPYFSLVHKGIKFCEYVGVIQVGQTIIEVLPKADKNPNSEAEQTKWRDILIDMLQTIGVFEVKSTSQSNLQLKSNSILDLYFALFIKEVTFLLHGGLVKKYRRIEQNSNALKGSLIFGKHIQQNLTHQERFYVQHTHYDTQHTLHQILYKTLKLLKRINTNSAIHSQIGALLLNFPEMPDVKVSAATFEKINFDRKTQVYQKAIEIAKMLLLQYHPDLSAGKNDVLALMFDMNLLWEQFVYVSLKKQFGKEHKFYAQSRQLFWKSENRSLSIKPDIVINPKTDNCIVLDTKWKNLDGTKPSADDLRQMYVYGQYYGAKKVALVYPSNQNAYFKGDFAKQPKEMTVKECGLLAVGFEYVKETKKAKFEFTLKPLGICE